MFQGPAVLNSLILILIETDPLPSISLNDGFFSHLYKLREGEGWAATGSTRFKTSFFSSYILLQKYLCVHEENLGWFKR